MDSGSIQPASGAARIGAGGGASAGRRRLRNRFHEIHVVEQLGQLQRQLGAGQSLLGRELATQQISPSEQRLQVLRGQGQRLVVSLQRLHRLLALHQ